MHNLQYAIMNNANEITFVKTLAEAAAAKKAGMSVTTVLSEVPREKPHLTPKRQALVVKAAKPSYRKEVAK